jgi:hypothetical protein
MKKVINIICLAPIAPVLLGWSYILLLYLHNIGELNFGVLFAPMSVVFIVEIFLFLILRKVYGIYKSIIFLSLSTVMFFSFGDSNILISFFITRIKLLQHYDNQISLLIYLIIFFLIYRYILRNEKYLISIVRYLLIVSVIILLNPVIRTGYFEITQRSSKNVKSQLIIPDENLIKDKNEFPDVYYIVPDSYSASTALKKYFGFDNSTFTNLLVEKGFYIAEKSTSNYPKTYLSLTSSLNMEYLDFLSVNVDSINETLIDPLIKNNNLVLFLKKHGYNYYQLGSWWWSTQYNKLATKNYNLDLINPTGINAFNSIIINNSLIKPMLPDQLFNSIVTESVDDKRRRIIYQFETLPKVAKLPGPKFVFAHIIAPHGPNVFGKNCEFITEDQLIGVADEVGYTNQVACINKYLINSIDAIMKSSSRPPVIIIQSDEGAPFLADRLNPPNNWKSADAKMLNEKFPILGAYYFPDGNYTTLYKSITPVNSFRIILNKYFNTNIPLLSDRNYVNLDMQHLYEFKEVTQEITNVR